MTYRIYKEGIRGYEVECQVFNIDDLFIVLDMLIIEEENNNVLVVEHNVEENYDFPMYQYTGDVRKYIDFKDNYYYNENKKGR